MSHVLAAVAVMLLPVILMGTLTASLAGLMNMLMEPMTPLPQAPPLITL